MEQSQFCPDSHTFKVIVSSTFSQVRLDHYVVQAGLGNVSRSQIAAAIRSGRITVNGLQVKPGHRLKDGDVVEGSVQEPRTDGLPVAQEVDFEVLYEDSSIIVISKPPGLVVHPGSGNQDHTLVSGLLFRFKDVSEVGESSRPGIVHRLDKDTSGVMVIARNNTALQQLVQDFKDRRTEKEYLALVHGVPQAESGRIVAPIGRHRVNRQKMAIRTRTGKYAATEYCLEQRFNRYSLLRLRIETGRTHQIRVHLASIHHPVAGDRVYGPGRNNKAFARHLLHAWKLSIPHPESGKWMHFTAPLVDDFQVVLDGLNRGEIC